MILKNLRIENLRNLSAGEVEFSPTCNIVIGHNGQGKTSLLEAVYLLGCGKSFRTHQSAEAIRHGAARTLVAGVVYRGDFHRELTLGLFERGKKYWVNRREESLLHYLGVLDVLAITGDQMPIVKGYPEERRRFMDRSLTALQPTYLQTLLDYQRVLRQKNTLLRDIKEGRRPNDPDLIEAWNVELVDYGAKIVQARHHFVTELKSRLAVNPLSQDVIKAKYLPMPSVDLAQVDLTVYQETLRAKLIEKRAQEIAGGHALLGPHRDDLLLFVNGKSLQKFGSAGQQRSVLLSLNLSFLEIYHESTGDFPTVLIDDIDAELDLSRIDALLDYLSGKCQLFISTAKTDTVSRFLPLSRTFDLRAGQIHVKN